MTHAEQVSIPQTSTTARRLDAGGWGLFFIWVGVALLAHLGWGAGLLGVGAITLGVQVARASLKIGAEPFWIVVGALFLAGGMAEFLALEFDLLPVLLIIAGAGLLMSALRKNAR
jgi:hypothetical protein